MFAVIRLGIIGVCSGEADIIPLDTSCPLGANVFHAQKNQCQRFMYRLLVLYAIPPHCCETSTPFIRQSFFFRPVRETRPLKANFVLPRRFPFPETRVISAVCLFHRSSFGHLSSAPTAADVKRTRPSAEMGRIGTPAVGAVRDSGFSRTFPSQRDMWVPCHVIDDDYLSSDFVPSTSSIKNTSESNVILLLAYYY